MISVECMGVQYFKADMVPSLLGRMYGLVELRELVKRVVKPEVQ